MNIEEQSDNRYNKSPDQIERYLLSLIQRYLQSGNIAEPASKENIIQQCVDRLHDEINFDAIGVLSISLPNDTEPRTGNVSISLEELNGEPIISPKLSAFNVNFGQEPNTACEGNDPRLFDKRAPLPHKHDISEINGLTNKLQTIETLLSTSHEENHVHDNKNVLDKIIYTGGNAFIDLGAPELLEQKVQTMIDNIKTKIDDYTQTILQESNNNQQSIQTIITKVNELKAYIDNLNTQYISESKAYTDTKIDSLNTDLNNTIQTLVPRSSMQDFVEFSNSTYTLVGTMTNADIITEVLDSGIYEFTLNTDILDELIKRNTNITDTIIDVNIKYETGKRSYYAPLPYIIINRHNNVVGTLYATVFSNGKVQVCFTGNANNVPDYVKTASIELSVYSTSLITLH